MAEGLFRLAHQRSDRSDVRGADRRALTELTDWFDEHLLEPTRFNRSASKGYYRQKTRGIAWFRDSATECVSRMYRVKEILENYGYEITMIRARRVGYIVYEDVQQVVAEPFAETETGSVK